MHTRNMLLSGLVICLAVALANSAPGTAPRTVESGILNQNAQHDGISNRLSADRYEFVSISIDNAIDVFPIDINNQRVVSGYYFDSAGDIHTFVWDDGQISTIDYPGATFTSVAAITNSGLLFGNWGSWDAQHAGYYNPETNTWTQLPDIAGYPLNYGSRMTDSGMSVGIACNMNACVSWIWKGKSYEFITYPGSSYTYANGVNNHGEIVGYWIDINSTDPFPFFGLYQYKGVMQDLTVATSAGSVRAPAYDINSRGEILAVAPLDPQDYWPSIVISGDTFIVLPKAPDVLRTFYQGMNDRGDLVGTTFNDPSGSPTSGFIAFRGGR